MTICVKKNQKDLVDYFIQVGHKNASVVYLSQSYFMVPKNIRLNCSQFCLYSIPTSREPNELSKELGVTVAQFNKATSEPYSFLHKDDQTKRVIFFHHSNFKYNVK